MTSSLPMQIAKPLDHGLNQINQLIWPVSHKVDYTSQTFFAFKAFPKALKSVEKEKWVNLQIKTLSPFSKGDQYYHVSNIGLHIWYSPNALNGVPESACQNALSDGKHNVEGRHFNYEQIWQQGTLVDCIAKPLKHESQSIDLTKSELSQSWAVERMLDKELKKPASWLIICVFAFVCGLAWNGAGYLTVQIQQSRTEQQNNQLSDELGDKLAQQTLLRDNQLALSTLNEWQQGQGFFPKSLGLIAEKLNEQGEWKVNLITWQNKSMEVELMATDIDITQLIGALEKLEEIEKVNIRPHNAENTWILEAKVK